MHILAELVQQITNSYMQRNNITLRIQSSLLQIINVQIWDVVSLI